MITVLCWAVDPDLKVQMWVLRRYDDPDVATTTAEIRGLYRWAIGHASWYSGRVSMCIARDGVSGWMTTQTRPIDAVLAQVRLNEIARHAGDTRRARWWRLIRRHVAAVCRGARLTFSRFRALKKYRE